MSLRRRVFRVVGLLTALAMIFGAVAGTASAKRVSAKQKAKVRAELKRAVKKNPRVVLRKSFLKKAALVDFTLPITVRLRGSNNNTPADPVFATSNPNAATVDLGASLGQRTVNLGGNLPGEVQFNDAYDGGALGNVRLALNPSTTGGLTTTSVPLLWNKNTSTDGATHPWWGISFNGSNLTALGFPDFSDTQYDDGCGSFTGTSSVNVAPFGPSATGLVNGYTSGVPYFNPTAGFGPSIIDPTNILASVLTFQTLVGGGPANSVAAAAQVAGYIPEIPGVDSLSRIAASGEATAASPFTGASAFYGTGDTVDDEVNHIGTNANPFPYTSLVTPGSPQYNNAQDTVLRTGNIALSIATPGTEVNQVNGTGVQNSQNIVIGKSGGQANLFGNIPGKGYGIDVTVSLKGDINSILREVDPENQPLIVGGEWPPSAFNCRQAWTGKVQNFFAGVRLKGDLKIAPAITKDGRLRIAKASLSSIQPTEISVAACLYPHAVFATALNSSDTGPSTVPTLPINEHSRRTAPTVDCKATPTELVRTAGLGPLNLTTLPGGPQSGYTTSNDGARVSVAAQLNVTRVSADVLIGQNQG